MNRDHRIRRVLLSCLVLITLGGVPVLAQLPTVYQSLPSYPPKPKIHRSTDGPKPGSPVPKNGKSRERFAINESHPPKLRLLVRASCNAPLKDKQLIDIAQATKVGGRALVKDWGDVSGKGRVSLYAVISVRKWQRRIEMADQDGTYQTLGSKVEDEYQWSVQKLSDPATGSPCFDEDKLNKDQLWNMIFSGLQRVADQNRLGHAG